MRKILLVKIISFCFLSLSFISCANMSYRTASKKNTIESYQNFLENYPSTKDSRQARLKLYNLEFENAQKINSIEAYEQFLKKYPDGNHKQNARDACEKIEFENAQKINSIEAYEQFLKKYPDGNHKQNARDACEKIEFENAQKINSIEAYEQFLKKYPDGRQAKKIVEMLHFEQAKASDSIFAYMSYLKNHPDGSGVKKIQGRLRELRYEDAIKRKTFAAFELFFSRYSEGNDVDKLKAEFTNIQALEKAWKTAKDDNTIDSYKNYMAVFPDGQYAKEAKARIQIYEFYSSFGIAEEFSEDQIWDYIESLENETYSTNLKDPIEYYIIRHNKFDYCSLPYKGKKVVRPSPGQKACSLQLEANNFSIEAFYITDPSISPITRSLFPNKWYHSFTHNGCAGPGLEIDIPPDRCKEFEKFLDIFSIFYHKRISTNRNLLGYVIPDLVYGSHETDVSTYEHRGAKFDIKHNDRKIVFKVDGLAGMPIKPITSYRQALALKTFLKVAVNR